jgi:kinesin family member 2/24
LINRVKSLSKDGNPKKEQFPVPSVSSSKVSTYPAYPLSGEAEETIERTQETRPLDASRKGVDNVISNSSMEPERNSSSMIPSYQNRGKEETSSRSGLNPTRLVLLVENSISGFGKFSRGGENHKSITTSDKS